ncbi:hypothetical protein XENOCAPTIV_028288 [Xenoophorus captivus]|uniref:Uncharacterized protein n=1 Tax=Xenoophorus captivus TaxID=1517983 RepID=A0ABV0QX74_9TELE
MSITMDRYTYTPNLLLNKRLTPLLSPSGRNPSLHPRIISHISRYTKDREREIERVKECEEGAEKKERKRGEGVNGAKKTKKRNLQGHSSVPIRDQGVMESQV